METDMMADLTTAASGSPEALLYQEIITRTPAGRFGNPMNAPEPLSFWLRELPISSPALPAALTAVTPSGESWRGPYQIAPIEALGPPAGERVRAAYSH